jgi:hypothetical protein
MALFSDNITSITQDKIVPKVIDTVINASPLTLKILGNQERFRGTTMGIPLKYQKSDAGLAFDGLEEFAHDKQETRVKMYFEPTGYEKHVAISGIEADINAGDEKVLDLVKTECASTAQDMVDEITDQFYAFQSGKNFLGLNDACDDGTTATTYGNLARSTYTGLAGNLTSSSGAVTVAKWGAQVDACTHGSHRPNLIVTTASIFRTFEALATPTHNLNTTGYPQVTRTGIAPGVQALGGQQGFGYLAFRGIPVVVDENCPSGYAYFLNLDRIKFYGLPATMPGYSNVNFNSGDIDSAQGDLPNSIGFKWSGFKVPVNQYGMVGHILLVGNLISDNPRTLGMLTSVT